MIYLNMSIKQQIYLLMLAGELFLLFTFCCLSASLKLDDLPPQNPIIGIFTQTFNNLPNQTYIAASYVKFIEMSGAQVVPIFSMSPKEQIQLILTKINGVLFPGGGMDFNINQRWTQNADIILKYAIQSKKNGNPFPIWGTCLGFQLLNYLTSGYDSKVLTPVRGEDAIVNPLNMTGQKSYIFESFPSNIMEKVTKGTGLLYFNHHWSVTPQTHINNRLLGDFWNIISTTKSPYNEIFISTMEAKQYPIYGVQFHPEKNSYQWKISADRTAEGIEAPQIISNKFVQIARQNKNRFSSPEQFTKASIYKYQTSTESSSFTEIYIFAEKVVKSTKNQN